jgi:hypothetical protein
LLQIVYAVIESRVRSVGVWVWGMWTIVKGFLGFKV